MAQNHLIHHKPCEYEFLSVYTTVFYYNTALIIKFSLQVEIYYRFLRYCKGGKRILYPFTAMHDHLTVTAADLLQVLTPGKDFPLHRLGYC